VLPGTPRAGSPVAISPYAANVVFIDPNGDVVNDYISGSRWKGPYELGGTAEADSGLAFSPGSSTAGTRPAVIFVNASGNLSYDYFASGWHGPAVCPVPRRPAPRSPGAETGRRSISSSPTACGVPKLCRAPDLPR
jgi:hypothetical protein